MTGPLVSIVINNFNYDRFLGRCIDSALAQRHPRVEVVVVDDASTDGSAAVVRGYGDAVKAVLKTGNEGQSAAFNDGYLASRGDIVIFLDSDDHLYPEAAARVVAAWSPGVAKVQYRLDLLDEESRRIDLFPPRETSFDSGDVVPLLLARGRYSTTVTSGNAFARSALERIMPVPTFFREGGDGYLVTVAPLYGTVVSIDDALGAYVQHGRNHSSFAGQLATRLRWRIDHDLRRYGALWEQAVALGLRPVPEPGLRDAFHLESRLGSLCLAPEQHPVPRDDRWSLALRGAWASREVPLPPARRTVLGAWFLAAGFLPRTLARPVVLWRMQQDSRPKALDRLLRRVRKLVS